MNKKIVLSIFSIVSALAIMGGATFAFFSNSGTSSGNVFATGTLELKLTDVSETDQDNVTVSFGDTLAPGQCTGNQGLKLKNSGTIAANHAEVRLTLNTVTDAAPAAAFPIDQYLQIATLTYDGVDVTSQFGNTNSTAFRDLDDWENSPAALDNLALTNLGTDHEILLNVCLDSSAPNDLQGDSVSTTFTVDLNQDASQ